MVIDYNQETIIDNLLQEILPSIDANQHDYGFIATLFPKDPNLTVVESDMSLAHGLHLILASNSKLLPVLVNGKLEGVFTLRSFSVRLNTFWQGRGKKQLDPATIEIMDFSERDDIPLLAQDEHIKDLVEAFRENEAVVIGTSTSIRCVVSPEDLIEKLWEIAGPYVLVQEIEKAYRDLIRLVFEDEDIVEVISRALSPLPHYMEESHKIPNTLEEMDFSELAGVIFSKQSWPRFIERYRLGPRNFAKSDFDHANKIRNKVSHPDKGTADRNDRQFLFKLRMNLSRAMRGN